MWTPRCEYMYIYRCATAFLGNKSVSDTNATKGCRNLTELFFKCLDHIIETKNYFSDGWMSILLFSIHTAIFCSIFFWKIKIQELVSPKIIRSANAWSTCLGGPLMKARAHFGDVKNFTYEPGRQIDQVMVTWSPGLRITRGSFWD